MANTCTGAITFYSNDKEQIQKLKEKLEEIYNDESVEDERYRGWMEYFAKAFYPHIDTEKIECGGSVELDDEISKREEFYFFVMWYESNWTAKIGLWAHIINDFYPEVKIAYVGEECGCSYFVKWDETGLFYPEETYVDIYYPTKAGNDTYIDDHYCWDINNLTEWCEENLPFTFEHKETLTELGEEINKKLKEIDEDFYCQADTYAEIAPEVFDWRY